MHLLSKSVRILEAVEGSAANFGGTGREQKEWGTS